MMISEKGERYSENDEKHEGHLFQHLCLVSLSQTVAKSLPRVLASEIQFGMTDDFTVGLGGRGGGEGA